jgi:beta-lactamase class A
VLRASAVVLGLSLVAAACSDGGSTPPTTSPATTTTAPSTTGATTQPPVDASTSTTGPAATQVVVGTSAGGNPISAITLGSGDLRVYVIGSIHDSPVGGGEVADRLDDPPAGVAIRIADDANPDGTAGGFETTAAGVDLAEQWGASPEAPEVRALAADIAAFDPAAIVVLDSRSDGRYITANPAGAALAPWFLTTEDLALDPWPVLDAHEPGSTSLEGHFDALGVPVVTAVANRWDDGGWLATAFAGGIRLVAQAAAAPGLAPPPALRCALPPSGTASCSQRTVRASTALDAALTGGDGGFLLKRIGGPVLAAEDADVRFYPASAIKVVHLLAALRFSRGDPELLATAVPEFFDSCDGSGSSVERSMDDLLDRMLLVSDNEATNALQDFFGLEALNALMAEAGMADSTLFHRFGCGGPANDPHNLATAADLVSLYDGVGRGALLPADLIATFFDRMLDPGEGPAAPAGVPIGTFQDLGPDVSLSVKAGWFGTTLIVGGVIDAGDGPLAFAVWTDGASALAPGFEMQDVVEALLQEELAPPAG